MLLDECPAVIKIYIFQIKTSILIVNYLVENVLKILMYLSYQEFKRVDLIQLLKRLFYMDNSP